MADAIALAKAGSDAASRIEAAAKAEDEAQASQARTETMQVCLNCHRTHATRDEANNFSIVFRQAGTPAKATTGTGVGPRTDGGSGGGIYQPGSGVVAPVPLRRPSPNYTGAAMRMKAQGTVVVGAIVEPDGSITNVRVIRSLDPIFGLDAEAVKAAREWRFNPGTHDGEPVRVSISIEMSFTLR